MRGYLFHAGVRFFVGLIFSILAYYIVNHSNFYYLFIGNVLLTLGVALLVEGIWFALFAVFKKLSARKTAILSTTRSTFIILFLAESVVRMTGIMETYAEQSDGNYFSVAQHEKRTSWYWVYEPNTVIENDRKEFVFRRTTNSIGITEKELSKDKGSKFRVLALGDSFTEGVGVNYENTWVKGMESRWKELNLETINAGIGGSDPVYEFVLYRDKLIAYQPDVVIMTINTTDIADIVGRGGFERFHTDGTAGKEPPAWEWIYASNHLVRMVANSLFGYNPSLVRYSDRKVNMEKAVKHIKEVLVKLQHLTRQQKSKLLVVLQPSLQDFSDGKHTPFFGQIELGNYMKSINIQYVDASSVFRKKGKKVSDYYYPMDTHFNEKGYALFGKTIYEKLEELIR